MINAVIYVQCVSEAQMRWPPLRYKGNILDMLIFTLRFEGWSRNLQYDREERDQARKKLCEHNHGSMNVARGFGTDEGVSVAKVKVKQRGWCRDWDTGGESSGG